MSKPKIVYVYDTLSDVRFLDGFHEIFSMIVLRPESASATNEPKSQISEVVTKGGRALFLLKGLWWLIRNKNRYEAAVSLDNVTASLVANLAGLITRRPVVQVEGRTTVEYFSTRQQAGDQGFKFKVMLALLKVIVKVNDRLATAPGMATKSIADVSKNPGRVVIPWYGIDTHAYVPDMSRDEARRALDIPLDPAIALYRSRLAPEKDPDTFLKGVALLREQGRDILAMYVGGEFGEFIELAEKYGVPHIARGHVHPLDELPKYYRASDVMVQTSKAEGLALSTLEALASGVPVIATATGGMLETIRDGDTGLHVGMMDHEGVARQIARLLDDEEEALRLASNGRRMVEEEYSAEVTFEMWLKLAEKVIAEAKR